MIKKIKTLSLALSILISNFPLSAQNETVTDSVLVSFIQEKTSYNPSDPIPESTTYSGKTLAFPWLFLNHSQWQDLSSKLNDPYFKKLQDRNLHFLNQFIEKSQNVSHTDVAEMIPLNTRIRTLKGIVEGSTVAWYITGDSIYLKMAERAIWLSCKSDDWSSINWGRLHLRSADLQTGELMYNVAFGYDALHPYLNDTLKQICLEALIEKGLRAYIDGHLQRDWWVKCNFNWNSALHGNAGIAAMVIHEANPELSDFVLQLATEGLPYMIDAFYPDGGYIEGVMYQGTAIGHLTDFIVPFRKLTGNDLDLLKNDDFHETITFWQYMFAPDGFAYNFSDCNDNALYGLPQAFWWAQQLNQPEWTWDQERRVTTGGLFYGVESFWYRKVNQKSRKPELKRYRHFKGIDWAVWNGEKTWLAFRGGFNGGNHDNDELGTIILGHGEDRFLIDPGYGPKKASDHNCITIRSMEQNDRATAPIIESKEHEKGFYLSCDIQEAFPFSTEHYYRHLLLIDDHHLLLIDDVKGIDNTRVSVQGHFQTRYPTELLENGWLIKGPGESCKIEMLFNHAEPEKEQWNFRGPITKLKYWNYSDRVHSVQPILFSFNDEPVTYKLEDSGFSITVANSQHRFSFDEKGILRYMAE